MLLTYVPGCHNPRCGSGEGGSIIPGVNHRTRPAIGKSAPQIYALNDMVGGNFLQLISNKKM